MVTDQESRMKRGGGRWRDRVEKRGDEGRRNMGGEEEEGRQISGDEERREEEEQKDNDNAFILLRGMRATI